MGKKYLQNRMSLNWGLLAFGHLEYPRNQIITTQNTLEIAQQHLIVTYRQGKEEEVRDDNPITALLLNKTNTDSKIQRDWNITTKQITKTKDKELKQTEGLDTWETKQDTGEYNQLTNE